MNHLFFVSYCFYLIQMFYLKKNAISFIFHSTDQMLSFNACLCIVHQTNYADEIASHAWLFNDKIENRKSRRYYEFFKIIQCPKFSHHFHIKLLKITKKINNQKKN